MGLLYAKIKLEKDREKFVKEWNKLEIKILKFNLENDSKFKLDFFFTQYIHLLGAIEKDRNSVIRFN